MNQNETFYVQEPFGSLIANDAALISTDSAGKCVLWTRSLDKLMKIISLLRRPRSISFLRGQTSLSESTLNECLDLLMRAGVIRIYTNTPSVATNREKHNAIVLGICGSIQAAAMLPIATRLRTEIAEDVHIVFTKAAEAFVSLRAYRKLGFIVWTHDGTGSGSHSNSSHISIARSTSLCLIAPATAHFLSRLAVGSCSDYLALIALAHEGPVIIAPCMNASMLESKAVRRNIEQLRRDGFYIVEPRPGMSAGSTEVDLSDMSSIGISEYNVTYLLNAVLKSPFSKRSVNSMTDALAVGV